MLAIVICALVAGILKTCTAQGQQYLQVEPDNIYGTVKWTSHIFYNHDNGLAPKVDFKILANDWSGLNLTCRQGDVTDLVSIRGFQVDYLSRGSDRFECLGFVMYNSSAPGHTHKVSFRGEVTGRTGLPTASFFNISIRQASCHHGCLYMCSIFGISSEGTGVWRATSQNYGAVRAKRHVMIAPDTWDQPADGSGSQVGEVQRSRRTVDSSPGTTVFGLLVIIVILILNIATFAVVMKIYCRSRTESTAKEVSGSRATVTNEEPNPNRTLKTRPNKGKDRTDIKSVTSKSHIKSTKGARKKTSTANAHDPNTDSAPGDMIRARKVSPPRPPPPTRPDVPNTSRPAERRSSLKQTASQVDTTQRKASVKPVHDRRYTDEMIYEGLRKSSQIFSNHPSVSRSSAPQPSFPTQTSHVLSGVPDNNSTTRPIPNRTHMESRLVDMDSQFQKQTLMNLPSAHMSQVNKAPSLSIHSSCVGTRPLSEGSQINRQTTSNLGPAAVRSVLLSGQGSMVVSSSTPGAVSLTRVQPSTTYNSTPVVATSHGGQKSVCNPSPMPGERTRAEHVPATVAPAQAMSVGQPILHFSAASTVQALSGGQTKVVYSPPPVAPPLPGVQTIAVPSSTPRTPETGQSYYKADLRGTLLEQIRNRDNVNLTPVKNVSAPKRRDSRADALFKAMMQRRVHTAPSGSVTGSGISVCLKDSDVW
ncbi:hypothetical protein ScPMuIL_012329 [Solemya velum]